MRRILKETSARRWGRNVSVNVWRIVHRRGTAPGALIGAQSVQTLGKLQSPCREINFKEQDNRKAAWMKL
jgi:hypothetical protein